MIDSVRFLKQCLHDHSRLVDIVVGRPEPLVKQGMELMQGLLSEMFGLPGPDVQGHTQDFLPEVVEVSESEVKDENRLEMELASDSDSEAEILRETTQAGDFMDIEASEASGSASSDSDDESTSERPDDHDDNTSEPFNSSTVTTKKSRKTIQQQCLEWQQQKETCSRIARQGQHERAMRRKRREQAKEAGKAVGSRSITPALHESASDQDVLQDEDHGRIKRQKKRHATPEELPKSEITDQKQPPILRQTTLSFNQVQKSRRLFSRKELSRRSMLKSEEEQKKSGESDEVVEADALRRNPRRRYAPDLDYNIDRIQPGYRWLFG